MVAAQNPSNQIFATPAANISPAGTVGVISATKGYVVARRVELRPRIQF